MARKIGLSRGSWVLQVMARVVGSVVRVGRDIVAVRREALCRVT